jgi:heme/copper-type cytochrome/quinol oxidase subunit 2
LVFLGYSFQGVAVVVVVVVVVMVVAAGLLILLAIRVEADFRISQTQKRGAGRLCLEMSPTTVTFIAHQEFATPVLAHMFDCLVRVSRRGEENNFVSITSTSD